MSEILSTKQCKSNTINNIPQRITASYNEMSPNAYEKINACIIIIFIILFYSVIICLLISLNHFHSNLHKLKAQIPFEIISLSASGQQNPSSIFESSLK